MNQSDSVLLKNRKTNAIITVIYTILMGILLPIYSITPLYILSCVLICIFGESAKTDLEKRIIPNKYMVFGMMTGLLEVILHYTLSISFYEDIIDAVIGFLLMPGIFFGISLLIEYLLKKETIGMGDIKAISVVGLVLGYKYQYIFILITMLIAFIASTIKVIRKKSIRVTMPMAPAMLFSLFITLFLAGIMKFQ